MVSIWAVTEGGTSQFESIVIHHQPGLSLVLFNGTRNTETLECKCGCVELDNLLGITPPGASGWALILSISFLPVFSGPVIRLVAKRGANANPSSMLPNQ